MFLKNKPNGSATPNKALLTKKDTIPSIIAEDMNLLGNVISEGVLDFAGTIDGNVRCHTMTIRASGKINGEVVAENIFVYGKVKGIIRARNVCLYASCHIEGIIMHHSISIEDGAFIDGKCKRIDKQSDGGSGDAYPEDMENIKILENIRLIS